jgi:hypothetical protein
MEAGVNRRCLPLLLGLVLLLRLPFLNQAIQGDDHIYLTEAAHALVDPLHPSGTKYVFLGDEVDLRGHSHPPLNAWVLAGLLVIFGDVKEVPFHAAYVLFSLIAVAAMWSLARRFSPRPVWAVLLFMAVPAFVVNGGSLESDLPFLALWMAAIALFCSGRLLWAAVAMALAAMTAYQAVFLTPILAVYVWLFRRRDRRAWLVLLVPPLTVAAWQLFERVSTGAVPAGMLAGYFQSYGFQALFRKLRNAEALFVHAWFIVFPVLVPGAFLLAWRKRREPETRFLLAWIAIFFAGALAVFFAGSARYLLPMAAPVALLASQTDVGKLKHAPPVGHALACPKLLAIGFALQMALSLGLAAANYQHWDGYRKFAANLRGPAGHRVWVDGEWGLRYYLESDGALPLSKSGKLRAGDILVSSELGSSVHPVAPFAPLAAAEIGSAIPLRLIGLETRSGYSDASRGLWPFGVSAGPFDRVRAELVVERHPTLEYLPMNAPEAAQQIVSGIYSLEDNRYRWMSRNAVVVLRSPPAPLPLRAVFAIPGQARARRVTLLLDSREVVSKAYSGPGSYTLESEPVRPAGAEASVEIRIDQTFSAPGDARELGIVLTAVGFASR